MTAKNIMMTKTDLFENIIKRLVLCTLILHAAAQSQAGVLFEQAHTGSGALISITHPTERLFFRLAQP